MRASLVMKPIPHMRASPQMKPISDMRAVGGLYPAVKMRAIPEMKPKPFMRAKDEVKPILSMRATWEMEPAVAMRAEAGLKPVFSYASQPFYEAQWRNASLKKCETRACRANHKSYGTQAKYVSQNVEPSRLMRGLCFRTQPKTFFVSQIGRAHV